MASAWERKPGSAIIAIKFAGRKAWRLVVLRGGSGSRTFFPAARIAAIVILFM
jgi:uncharacterized protein GlcG (DUF336 family)